MKEGSVDLSQKSLWGENPDHEGVFCHFPPLFRHYDASVFAQSNADIDRSEPLLQDRLETDKALEPGFDRKPGAFRPSRIVRPDGKVETQTDATAFLDYVVISYTWGRWMEKSREYDTDLEGCKWKIPASTLFSRQELDAAVRKIAGGRNFWLDVFCIPQDDSDPEKGQEISRQGDIFSNATGAAIWLNTGGEAILREVCSWADTHRNQYALDMDPTPDLRPKEQTLHRFRILKSLPEAIPWTTSLWTLQETALRRDAVFHGRNGHPVLSIDTGKPLTVTDFVKVMTQIETDLQVLRSISHQLKEKDRVLFQEVMLNVERIALSNLDSMTARDLYLASKQRQCERSHDRIYAIMNALGVLVPVDYTAPIESVQAMFILKLYNTYPAEMQSFLEYMGDSGADVCWPSLYGLRSRSLSRMRQAPGDEPYAGFTNITSDGWLTATDVLRLDSASVDFICSLIAQSAAAICFDDKGQDRLVRNSSMDGEDHRAQQSRTARNLRTISKGERIVLISLGRLRPTSTIGPTSVYLVCLEAKGGIQSDATVRAFRIGLLISHKQVRGTESKNESVCIKHDLQGGKGSGDVESSHRWICDSETPMYFHPTWAIDEDCRCLEDYQD
ncbi:hypothetical protein EJ04DRAFT_596789 [Polyplosphaeria fusca]|uniref:Heterokaryon incompatibility domain-containing protein n=1 Tax=Polyplosphaeria fusca TaxID=682080 RepID=A0A9P4UW86_9PLEO|nr:hypothetical protein EJ04DRAFT_596789 [Polyplosphaeria fusca]